MALLAHAFRNAWFALRLLRKDGMSTLVVVGTLALTMGINAALFSVVNTILLQPLPFPDSQQLVSLSQVLESGSVLSGPVSYPQFQSWTEVTRPFASLAALRGDSVTLATDGWTDIVNATTTSASLFSMLRVSPIVGRLFSIEDDRAGGEAVILLSRHIWRERFGSDPGIVGHDVRVGNKTCLVVGVVPDLELPNASRPAVWLPLAVGLESRRQAGVLHDPRQRFLSVIGRLRDGVSTNAAETALAAGADANSKGGVRIVTLQAQMTAPFRQPLLFLLAVALFILLIACTNIANVLTVRFLSRRPEFALRMALGSRRSQLFAQVVTENIVLAACAGLVGVVLARWLLALLIQTAPVSIPRLSDVQLNPMVLVYTAAICLATALLFTITPLAILTRSDLQVLLRSTDRSATGSPYHRRLRYALLGLEIALSGTLLFGAGLAIRSLVAFVQTPLGFSPQQIATLRVTSPSGLDPAQQRAFYGQVLESLRVVPGAVSVGATQVLPLFGSEYTTSFTVVGQPKTATVVTSRYARVFGDYFEAMHVPLIRGRYLTRADNDHSARVAVINESFARTFLRSTNPTDHQLVIWDDDPSYEIVGVVADSVQQRIDAVPQPLIYVPYEQHPRDALTFVVHSNREPQSVSAESAAMVRARFPRARVSDVLSMEKLVLDSVAPRWYIAIIMSIFGIGVAVIAAVGVYGVTAYTVAQRTKEIGVRLAMGADPRSLSRMLIGQTMRVALVAALGGLLGALAVARALHSLLYGVSATDPLTAGVSAALVLAVTTCAAYVAARRVLTIDVVAALRSE